MNRIFWPLTTVILITSLYWLLTGIGPQSIPVIKPSNFQSPSEISEYTYRQLSNRIPNYNFFAIGIEERQGYPVDQVEVQNTLLKKISDDLKSEAVIVSDRKLEKDFLPNVEKVWLEDIDRGKRLAKINELILANKKIIFLFSVLETIHFRKESIIKTLEEGLKIKVLSFSVAKFPLPVNEPNTLAAHCGRSSDEFNYNALACLVLSKARKVELNKKVSKTSLIGLVEQQGERDFVIYMH